MLIEPLSAVIVFCVVVTVPCALMLAWLSGYRRGHTRATQVNLRGLDALSEQLDKLTRSYALPPGRGQG